MINVLVEGDDYVTFTYHKALYMLRKDKFRVYTLLQIDKSSGFWRKVPYPEELLDDIAEYAAKSP